MWILKRLALVPAVLIATGGVSNVRVAAAADPCVFEDARLIAPTGGGVAPGLGAYVVMSGDGQTIVASDEQSLAHRVFRRSGVSGWTLEATLPPSIVAPRMAYSGATLLMNNSAGVMSIWTRSVGGTWSVTSTIGLPGNVPGQVFDISGDGQTVAVAAPNAGSGRGAVYVYRLQAGTWVQDGPVILGPIPATAAPSNFGGTRLRLDADGDTLAVAAVSLNEPPVEPESSVAQGALPVGAIAVYHREGGVWSATPQVLQWTFASGAMGGIQGPFDLSDDGLTLVAMRSSATLPVPNFEDPGRSSALPAAFVFQRVGGAWIQRGEPVWPPAIEPVPDWAAQVDVVLSQDARRAVISMFDFIRAGSRGRGFVFETRDGMLSRRFEPLTSPLVEDGSVLGLSVAISGDGSTVVLGAPNDRNGGEDQGWGSVIVYTLGSQLAVTSQPVRASVPRLGAVNFSCAASARVTPQYRWTLDGVPLADGLRPDGTSVLGSGAPMLSLTGVAGALDGAVFSCVITAACETKRSDAVSLRVTPACIEDLNGDGAVNTADLVVFLSGFGRSCP